MTDRTADAVVTIGFPVKDGGAAFPVAVRDILQQTDPRFRLIISDNASTDGTAALADGFAAQDARVRVLHQAADVGVVRNFNLLAEQAVADGDTPYFVWAAHDDRWEPDFLATAIELLEAAPQAAGALAGVDVGSERGGVEQIWRPAARIASADVVTRVGALRGTPWWYGFYAVHRVEVLREGGRFEQVWNADGLFVFHALLRRPYAVTDRVLRRYVISATRAKERGDQRSIRVNDPASLADAMRAAVIAEPSLGPDQRRRILADIRRLRWHLERSTRAYAARRGALDAIDERRWLAAAADGAAAMALAPVRTSRSLRTRLSRP